jgi:hypothetical protein
MKTLLYRGTVVPQICLPPNTMVSRVRKVFSERYKTPLGEYQLVTLEDGRKVKVYLNCQDRLPLNVVLKLLVS